MTNKLTPEGYEQLKKKLAELTLKRQELIEQIDEIRKSGDSDDGTFTNHLRDQLMILDRKIKEAERFLHGAQVVRIAQNGRVSIGSRVKVKIRDNEKLLEVVGDGEADPLNGKISHNSPLGQALLGKQAGDLVETEIPAGRITYEILSIEA